MEGFPYAEGGLEYLFGAVTVDEAGARCSTTGGPTTRPRSARRSRGSSTGSWRGGGGIRTLHVYHYAAYEETARQAADGQVRHPRGRGGRPAPARACFVDLYAVVRQGFVIGTPSYSLKDVEQLYLPPRDRDGALGRRVGGRVPAVDRQRASRGVRQESPILQGIREYNRVDCESLWGLRSWLLDRQRESGIAYVPDPLRRRTPPEPDARRAHAAEALAGAAASDAGHGAARARSPRTARLDQLVGWLVEFHRREEKPMWWRMFERHEMTVEERYDDPDCLAGLVADRDAAADDQAVARASSTASTPTRRPSCTRATTALVAGDRARVLEIVATGRGRRPGRAQGRPGQVAAGPALPDPERVSSSAEPIKEAVARYAAAWERGEVASQAVDDLLRRPRRPASRGPRRAARWSRAERRSRRRAVARPRPPGSTAPRSASRARPAPARPTPPPPSSSTCSRARQARRRHRPQPQGDPQPDGRRGRGARRGRASSAPLYKVGGRTRTTR